MREDQEEESKEPLRETYRRKVEESWRRMEIPTVMTEKGKLKASILLGSGGVQSYRQALCGRKKTQKATSSAGFYY